MSLRPILLWPDTRLRHDCAPINEIGDAIGELAEDMLETMYDAQGRGLAAPQVGVMIRLFVMDEGWKRGAPHPRVCVNPKFEPIGTATALGEEQCLSIPEHPVLVRRWQDVRMQWSDLDGARHSEELSGADAIIAQHEIDHLDGRLILERAQHHA